MNWIEILQIAAAAAAAALYSAGVITGAWFMALGFVAREPTPKPDAKAEQRISALSRHRGGRPRP